MNQHEKTPCVTCGEMVGKRMMFRHIQIKHTENADKKFKCSFCGKGFSNNQPLKDHVNIHQCLQDISFGDPHRETIAAHAELIMQTCEELKRIVSPPTCICCK